MQEELNEKIAYFNETAKMLNVPLHSDTATPVRFIALGKPQVGYNLVTRLMNSGLYTSLCVYPSVSYNNTGIRIAITRHLSKEDIYNLLNTISQLLPEVLAECGSNFKEINRYFKLGEN